MKTKVICHMITTIDGRLQVERYSKLFNSENQNFGLETYLNLHLKIDADAWMMGKGTVQAMGYDQIFHSDQQITPKNFTSFISHKTSSRWCVIFDSKGEIFFPDNNLEGDNIIVVLGEKISQEYLDYLQQKQISYCFAGENGKDHHIAMSVLYTDFGIKTLLLEGGGILNGTYLKEGLIDEISIVLYPGVDGLSGISSIFEYKGNDKNPAQGQSLELVDLQKLEKGLVWLKYKVHKEL